MIVNHVLLFLFVHNTHKAQSITTCEVKEINKEDESANAFSGINWLCPTSGPIWTGDLQYSLISQDLKTNRNKYELLWAFLLKRPGCVSRLQIAVNNQMISDENDPNETKPAIIEVDMPLCQKEHISIRIWIYWNFGFMCITVNMWIDNEMAKMTDFMNTIQRPATGYIDKGLEVFWHRGMFKFPRFAQCLTALIVTKDNGHVSYEPKNCPNSFVIYWRCDLQWTSITYIFNENFGRHTIKDFCETVNIKTTTNTATYNATKKTMKNVEKNTSIIRMTTVSFEKTTTSTSTKGRSDPQMEPKSIDGDNFFTKNHFQNTVILTCILGGLILTAIIVFLVCRKTRADREKEISDTVDENPIYGIYQVEYNVSNVTKPNPPHQDRLVESTFTDTNDLYGVNEDPEDSRVLDLNPEYE